MRHTCSNSFLTIAATAADDPSIGCFFDRDPVVVSPIKAHVSARCYTGDHYCVDGALWSVGILETPLNKRAWVFQERTLNFLSCYFPSCPILRQKSFRLVGRVL